MSPALLNKIPEEVREHVKMLLSVTPNVRPDADQMTKVCFVACFAHALRWFTSTVLIYFLTFIWWRISYFPCFCVIQIPFFDDVGAVTLQYFDSLFQRDNLQKSQFYKGLPKVLPKLPKVNPCKVLAVNSVCANQDALPTRSHSCFLREWSSIGFSRHWPQSSSTRTWFPLCFPMCSSSPRSAPRTSIFVSSCRTSRLFSSSRSLFR